MFVFVFGYFFVICIT